MKKNLFGVFLLLIIVISVVLFGLGLYYKSDIDNRTKAATPNFPGLPVAMCSVEILRLQPNSTTPLTPTLTVTPNQTFKVVVANSSTGTTVTGTSILVQKPDGTIVNVASNGAWEGASFAVSGEYIFVATKGSTCKTNYAYLTVSGTTGTTTSNTSSGSVVVNPVIPDPTLPGTTGATKTVCATGCNYTTIQDAVKNTPEKGKVFIKNGTYKNNFFFTDQGAKEVTVEGESVDGVIIDGSNNVGSVCNTANFGKPSGIYVIKNLTIKSSGGCAGISVGGDSLTATNDVNFTATNIKVIGSKGAGIYLKGTSLSKITNSTFTTSLYAGVSVHGKAKVKVTGSTFSSHTNQAIDLKDNAEGYFESNTIDNNGTTSVEQVLLMNSAIGGFKLNTFKNTKYTAYRVKNTAKLRSENDVFDGVTQSKKYIADSTATVTLITATTVSSSVSSVASGIHPSCVPYDFNHDGKVDIRDFAEWRVCYQKKGSVVIASAGCGFADIVKNDYVDIVDFAKFVVAYTNYRVDPYKICVK